MPLLCYLCKNKKATYIFPRDDARKKVWIDSLQLECEPPKHARLCSEHFLESDFHVRGGKKYLVSESIPTRSVKCKSYLADHNYALGMEYQDASFPPEIFVLTTIGKSYSIIFNKTIDIKLPSRLQHITTKCLSIH